MGVERQEHIICWKKFGLKKQSDVNLNSGFRTFLTPLLYQSLFAHLTKQVGRAREQHLLLHKIVRKI